MGLLRRLAFATASVLLAFSLWTAGVAYAAQEAIPGDTLYGVKRGIETARYSLTQNPQSQAALLSDLASERMREIQALADDGRDALLAPTLSDYVQTLDRLQAVANALPLNLQPQVLGQVSARMQQHQQALERLLGQVPCQAVPAIERAIERTSYSHEVLEAHQQGESPSDLAPGQDKEKERGGPKRTPGPPDGKNKPRAQRAKCVGRTRICWTHNLAAIRIRSWRQVLVHPRRACTQGPRPTPGGTIVWAKVGMRSATGPCCDHRPADAR